MSKFRNLDFTNYVNEQRKALITNARNKNRSIGYDASLGEAVSVNASIGEAETLKHEVRWIDIDGTILKRELVEDGATISHPANPAYDSTYLEFDRWISTGGDMNNVTKDIDFGAYYKTKEVTIGEITARPTIYKCYFDSSTGLNPKIRVTGSSTTYPLVIDWGDGTVETFTSGGDKTHTYAQEGYYVIRLVAAGTVSQNASPSDYCFGSQNLAKAVLAGYAGSFRLGMSAFYGCSNMRIVLVPDYSYAGGYSQGPSYFCSLANLATLIVPVGFMYQNSQLVSRDYVKSLSSWSYMQNAFSVADLKFAIFEDGIRYLPILHLYSVHKLVLPDSIYLFTSGIQYAYALEYLHLPSQLVRVFESLIRYAGEIKTIDLPTSFEMVSSDALIDSASCENFIVRGHIGALNVKNLYVENDLFLPLIGISKTLFGSGVRLKNVTFTEPNLVIAASLVTDSSTIGGVLTLPQGVSLTSPGYLTYAKHISFPQDFDSSVTLSGGYVKVDTFISFANNCKDLTGLTSKTLTVGSNMSILKSTFVDAQGNEVFPGTAGAISLYDKIIAKNWTVA